MRRPFLIAALVLAIPLATIRSGELEGAEVLDRLQGWLDATRDLQARFEQTLVSGAFGEGTVESGRIYLKRPGRMRWEYREPEHKIALVEGRQTRMYVEEDRQLWEGSLDEVDSLLPTLLAGERPLAELFTAELMATPKLGGEGSYRLRLEPRAATDDFERIVVVLAPPRFALHEVDVLDAAGNRMIYRFSRLERNEGLSDAAFHFEPPPGTEIVRPPPPTGQSVDGAEDGC